MKSGFPIVALVLTASLSLFGLGCDDDTPSSPTDVAPVFTAGLLPSNEVPPVTNADATGSGTVTITMHTTKDGAGNITAATADFTVMLQGFPPGTTLTGAHIHPGAAGVNGGIIWNLGLTTGEQVLANGSTTFTKTAVSPSDVVHAQAIINNPAGYYFNVHTTLTPSGAVRGQLVRAN
jgi:hypothetical protein